MSGNVWEYVSSVYRAYPYSGGRETTWWAETVQERVVRGGSRTFTNSSYLRGANRAHNLCNLATEVNGFRCVRDWE